VSVRGTIPGPPRKSVCGTGKATDHRGIATIETLEALQLSIRNSLVSQFILRSACDPRHILADDCGSAPVLSCWAERNVVRVARRRASRHSWWVMRGYEAARDARGETALAFCPLLAAWPGPGTKPHRRVGSRWLPGRTSCSSTSTTSGFGELSCYSGGPFRGTWTRRIDAFAGQGFRLTNYAPEAQCTPTRSALLTGRHAIRSGNHSVPLGAPGGWGLVAWEKTLGDLLSEAGYSCAVYGKWHVGEGPGRWPTGHGFAEWYGPPRTYDEALWVDDPWYDPKRDPVSRMVEIRQGERDVTEHDQLTLYGVKWRNFKLALAVQKYLTDPVGKLPSPHIINLIADPRNASR
jgi:hypothetical protein